MASEHLYITHQVQVATTNATSSKFVTEPTSWDVINLYKDHLDDFVLKLVRDISPEVRHQSNLPPLTTIIAWLNRTISNAQEIRSKSHTKHKHAIPDVSPRRKTCSSTTMSNNCNSTLEKIADISQISRCRKGPSIHVTPLKNQSQTWIISLDYHPLSDNIDNPHRLWSEGRQRQSQTMWTRVLSNCYRVRNVHCGNIWGRRTEDTGNHIDLVRARTDLEWCCTFLPRSPKMRRNRLVRTSNTKYRRPSDIDPCNQWDIGTCRARCLGQDIPHAHKKFAHFFAMEHESNPYTYVMSDQSSPVKRIRQDGTIPRTDERRPPVEETKHWKTWWTPPATVRSHIPIERQSTLCCLDLGNPNCNKKTSAVGFHAGIVVVHSANYQSKRLHRDATMVWIAPALCSTGSFSAGHPTMLG